MKERISRKLKKGLHSLLKHRDTKWKRKAMNIAQRAVQGVALRFTDSGFVIFESGGIVSDKPASGRGEYVIGKDEQERLREMLQQPVPETVHVSINLDDLSMAMKKRISRDIQR